MTKFKKGDIVRRVSDEGGEGRVRMGADYVVDTASDDYVSVELRDGTPSMYLYANRFELVTPERPKKAGKAKALQTQVGGTHYSDMAIQPAAYNLANNMGWAEGDAISYISRWRKKGGLQDLRKARQTLLLLIEHEESLGTA